MNAPSETFVAQVKDALDHLYEPARLGESPLVGLLVGQTPAGVRRAPALRQALLDAIEQLNPGATPVDARVRRAHQILSLRYVEALTYRDVMAELNLSQTQYHRDQRHAVESLAVVLWDRARQMSSAASAEPAAPAPEVEATADFIAIARGVVRMLGPLAAARGVGLRAELPLQVTQVAGDRTALRQSVISAVGFVLGAASQGEVVVTADESEGRLRLRIEHAGATDPAGFSSPDQQSRLRMAGEIVSYLDGGCGLARQPDRLTVTLDLPVRRRTLLVIDDNADIIQLVTRFVAAGDFAVLSAGSLAEALPLARRARPDAILLDIMMPGQDGWDALQTFRHEPATLDVPILVCTVLAEEELALALGATGFIRKPLTQPALLDALARWAPARPRSAEAR